MHNLVKSSVKRRHRVETAFSCDLRYRRIGVLLDFLNEFVNAYRVDVIIQTVGYIFVEYLRKVKRAVIELFGYGG